MSTRRLVSEPEYIRFLKDNYYLKREIFDTDEEKRIEKQIYDLCEELWKGIPARGLSLDTDLYVLFEFNRKRIVGMNFAGAHQVAAEEMAFELLQLPQWSDCAVELCGGRRDEMICGGEIELITKDEIVVQVNEIADNVTT